MKNILIEYIRGTRRVATTASRKHVINMVLIVFDKRTTIYRPKFKLPLQNSIITRNFNFASISSAPKIFPIIGHFEGKPEIYPKRRKTFKETALLAVKNADHPADVRAIIIFILMHFITETCLPFEILGFN